MDEIKGYIDYTFDDGRQVPLKLECHQLISQEHLAKNVAINMERNIPRFLNREGFGLVKGEPLAIVGCGPSLEYTINDLRDFKNIMVLGSAHDYVLSQGIVPKFALVSDGGKDDKDNLKLAHKDTTFLLASQCDPSLYDHLKDHKVEMWHYKAQLHKDEEEEKKLFHGEHSITWGSTVLLSSIHISLLIGHQYMHLFGADSCYGDYGLKHHVCDISGFEEYRKVAVDVGEGESKRTFVTDMGLVAQAQQLFQLIEMWRDILHVTIHGDNLLSWMVKCGEPGLEKYVVTA